MAVLLIKQDHLTSHMIYKFIIYLCPIFIKDSVIICPIQYYYKINIILLVMIHNKIKYPLYKVEYDQIEDEHILFVYTSYLVVLILILKHRINNRTNPIQEINSII